VARSATETAPVLTEPKVSIAKRICRGHSILRSISLRIGHGSESPCTAGLGFGSGRSLLRTPKEVEGAINGLSRPHPSEVKRSGKR
jgi:hypothetical protein